MPRIGTFWDPSYIYEGTNGDVTRIRRLRFMPGSPPVFLEGTPKEWDLLILPLFCLLLIRNELREDGEIKAFLRE